MMLFRYFVCRSARVKRQRVREREGKLSVCAFLSGARLRSNTKAAVVRIGLKEMETFIKEFYPETSSKVFGESCGVADLITTCFAGRNRKCAEAFAASRADGGEGRTWEDIEAEMLGGQKQRWH